MPATCSTEGCTAPPALIAAGRLLCDAHASAFRCAVEGCDCWADGSVDGRPLCRHHIVEHWQTRRTP